MKSIIYNFITFPYISFLISIMQSSNISYSVGSEFISHSVNLNISDSRSSMFCTLYLLWPRFYAQNCILKWFICTSLLAM